MRESPQHQVPKSPPLVSRELPRSPRHSLRSTPPQSPPMSPWTPPRSPLLMTRRSLGSRPLNLGSPQSSKREPNTTASSSVQRPPASCTSEGKSRAPAAQRRSGGGCSARSPVAHTPRTRPHPQAASSTSAPAQTTPQVTPPRSKKPPVPRQGPTSPIDELDRTMRLMTQVVRRQQTRLKEECGVAEARTKALQAGLIRKASHSPNSGKVNNRITWSGSRVTSGSRSRVTSGAASPATPARTPSVPRLHGSPHGAEGGAASPATPAETPSVPPPLPGSPCGLTRQEAAAINAEVAANVPVASGKTIADLAEPPPPMTLRRDITADIAEAIVEVKRLLRYRAGSNDRLDLNGSGHNDRLGVDSSQEMTQDVAR